MTKFIQVHALTVYAPSNLNRDDTGRPKTAKFGGVERLRISSQAMKRAIRTSDTFRARVGDNRGERTARVGELIRDQLIKLNVDAVKAAAIAKSMSAIVGTPDKDAKDGRLLNKELYFMAPQERAHLLSMSKEVAANTELAEELASVAGEIADDDDDEEAEDSTAGKGKKGKKKGMPKKRLAELRAKVLVTKDTAADIAMFGRMLAASAEYNREAAVQVAHAITTHRVEVEDDFYTAVDDLKKRSEDAGAGFIGELGFGSGVFYLYACIDRDLLQENLGGDADLTKVAIQAFIEGIATLSPTGKQASFASRSRASYLRIEKGHQQPRSLAAAFLKPVRGDDLLAKSIECLEDKERGLVALMSKAYGDCFSAAKTMQFIPGAADNVGSLPDLLTFASE